jgi:hypothetical protein
MKRGSIVEQATAIVAEYRLQGLNLTLRQMYYQFVSRGLCGSGQKEYNTIGAALTEARYSGAFPVTDLEDRGRAFASGSYSYDSVDVENALVMAKDNIRQFKYYIGRARWFGQKTHVVALFEKEALAGVFEPVCQRKGIGWMACKGYPSVSALHQALVDFESAIDSGAEQVQILYLGDHDPDGFGIPRAIMEKFELLRLLPQYRQDYTIKLDRLALNMDQIQRFNPPPFDAKETSPRFQRYVEEQQTHDAWELDALSPTVLRDLIADSVDEIFDRQIARENDLLVRQRQAELQLRLQDPAWLASIWE